MELNTKKLRRMTFPFTPADIDTAANFVSQALSDFQIDRKTALRTRLSLEEVLLKWQEGGGLADHFTVEIQRRMGRVLLSLKCQGAPANPTAAESDAEFGAGGLGRSMLETLGLSLSWQYHNGTNVLSCTLHKKRKMSQLMQVLIAMALALAIGGLGLLLPQGARDSVLNTLLDPLFNTFLGVFSCIVCPMMFLSMVWGIFNIGDARQLGTIGKKLLGRFMLISTVFGALCLGAALLFFSPELGAAQGGGDVLRSVIEMVLDIIPKNIVEPFSSGNTLQILFMGAVVGVVMILLRDRMQALSDIVEQSNAVVQFILSVISSMVPFFIFLSVLRLMLQGTLFSSAAGLLKVILLSVALTLLAIIVETLSLIRLGLSPKQALKKLGGTFLIALTTASSAAAMPSAMETCTKKLGIDEKLTNFALPFGSVVFMPQAVNLFILVPLFVAQLYGVELTVGSLILCLINAVVLSVAAPPIPGGALSCYTLMFMQLGIPLEGISLAVAANIILDFTATSGNLYDLMVQLTHGAKKLNMLDEAALRSNK